jgi:hypothetical protein
MKNALHQLSFMLFGSAGLTAAACWWISVQKILQHRQQRRVGRYLCRKFCSKDSGGLLVNICAENSVAKTAEACWWISVQKIL